MLRLLVVVVLVLLPWTPRAQTPVDLELVLAVDMSGSMDTSEHALQRAGYVAALAHPDVVDAIRFGLHGRIAVTYVEWGGPASHEIRVPWTLVEDAASAATFASALDAAPLYTIRGTSISGALDFAAKLFDGNGYDGLRRVIDVSGDGANSRGRPVVPARDDALARGIIVNGLPLMLNPSLQGGGGLPSLDAYYRDCVIGGPGSFVVPVVERRQIAEAIRRKLVLEIAGTPPRALPVAAAPAQTGTDCMIGEKQRRTWQLR